MGQENGTSVPPSTTEGYRADLKVRKVGRRRYKKKSKKKARKSGHISAHCYHNEETTSSSDNASVVIAPSLSQQSGCKKKRKKKKKNSSCDKDAQEKKNALSTEYESSSQESLYDLEEAEEETGVTTIFPESTESMILSDFHQEPRKFKNFSFEASLQDLVKVSWLFVCCLP